MRTMETSVCFFLAGCAQLGTSNPRQLAGPLDTLRMVQGLPSAYGSRQRVAAIKRRVQVRESLEFKIQRVVGEE